MSQRKYDRAPFEGSVAFCQQREATVVRPKNVGAGGMLVTTPEGWTLKSLLTLHIALPGQKRGITVMGRVVRAAAREVAVEFVGLMPKERNLLLAHVNAMLAPQARAG